MKTMKYFLRQKTVSLLNSINFIYYRSKDPKYDHLTQDDLSEMEKAYSHAYQWLDQTRVNIVNAPKHLPPPVTVAQIRQEKSNFEKIVNSVVNKPVPKASSPPRDDKTSGDQQKGNQAQQNQQAQNGEKQENMEWSPTN